MLTSYKIQQLTMYDSILLVSNPYHAANIYFQLKKQIQQHDTDDQAISVVKRLTMHDSIFYWFQISIMLLYLFSVQKQIQQHF